MFTVDVKQQYNKSTRFLYKFHKLPQYKCQESKIDLAIKTSRSTQGHHLNILRQNLQKCPGISLFPCLTLPWKRSRSTHCHYLNNLEITGVPHTAYQLSRPSVNWFWRRLWRFDHIWAWWPCWSCEFDRLNNICSLNPRRLHKIWLQLNWWIVKIEMFEIVILWVSWIKD